MADILGAGAIPVVLGGDHSLSTPVLEALAAHHGRDGFSVVHFDTHADTGSDEREAPHGVPFYQAVRAGHLDGHNIVQIGLRGAWPFPEEFQWMREAGFRWHTTGEIVERGIGPVVRDAIEHARARAPRTYLTVDIDVLDPAFAPGTGTRVFVRVGHRQDQLDRPRAALRRSAGIFGFLVAFAGTMLLLVSRSRIWW